MGSVSSTKKQQDKRKFCQGRIRLTLGKTFFTIRSCQALNRLPWAMDKSPSLEGCKICADVELEDMI